MNLFRWQCLALVTVLLLAPASFGAEHEADPTAPIPLRLSVGKTIRLQLSTRKAIRTAINDNDQVARVQPIIGDLTSVLVTGLIPGRTRITLIGVDGKKEVRGVGGKPRR